MKVADFTAENPGTWLFHCHVAEHMREGMTARLTVLGRDTVGVDRGPARAFLGHPAAAQSLRLAPATRQAGNAWSVRGAVTVFDGFAVFNETVRLRWGGRSWEFRPDQQGVARAGTAWFRVTNANEVGVVRGGLMEFELQVDLPGPGEGAPELTLDVGRAHHRARVRFAGAR